MNNPAALRPAMIALYADPAHPLHWYDRPGAPWTPAADLGQTLRELTVHFTAEPTLAGQPDRYYRALIEREARYHAFVRDWAPDVPGAQGGDGYMYHYAISPTGGVYQTTPETKRTWNAYEANARNLAVVLLAGPHDPPTGAAVRSLFTLLNWLCWGRPDLPHIQALPGSGTVGVLGHDESLIRQGRPPKGCPGPYLGIVQQWRAAAKAGRGPVPLP